MDRDNNPAPFPVPPAPINCASKLFTLSKRLCWSTNSFWIAGATSSVWNLISGSFSCFSSRTCASFSAPSRIGSGSCSVGPTSEKTPKKRKKSEKESRKRVCTFCQILNLFMNTILSSPVGLTHPSIKSESSIPSMHRASADNLSPLGASLIIDAVSCLFRKQQKPKVSRNSNGGH